MYGMLKMAIALKDRYMSQKAQGMVEYALIIAFVVAIAVVLSSGDLGSAIRGVFTTAASQISNPSSPAAAAGT